MNDKLYRIDLNAYAKIYDQTYGDLAPFYRSELERLGVLVEFEPDYSAAQDERDKGSWVSTKSIVDAALKGTDNG